jgi:hypothetical protein
MKFVKVTNLDRNPGKANPDPQKKMLATFPPELRFCLVAVPGASDERKG